MKILVTYFPIENVGGIAQSHELMYKGLVAEGHDVDFIVLKPTDREPQVSRPTTVRKGAYPSVMGGVVHTEAGWFGQKIMSYGSDARVDEYRRMADGYDLIVHQIPVPKPDMGNWWRKLYSVEPPQVAWIHDANFRNFYPHLIFVAHKLAGITTSNQAGYASAAWLPTPRAFLGVPQELLDWNRLLPWKKRNPQAVCAHVWKAWKHMERVVEALPLIHEPTKLVLGGDGIERRYMASKEKRKPKYKTLWEKAQRAGMDFRDMLTHDELFSLYQESRVMIDLSYSKRFVELGSHFNRSLLEAYNNGLVPITTDVNMRDAFASQRTLWEPFETHIPVTIDDGPERLAEAIENTVNMHQEDAMEIVANGRRILAKYFEYRQFARNLIALSQGQSCGVYPKLETGAPPPGFRDEARQFVVENAR